MSHNHDCEQEHHNHSHTAPLPTNAKQSLYKSIDVSQVRCLNVVSKGTASSLNSGFIKSHAEKYNVSKYIESDADCQMLLLIPFTSSCKLFSIIFRAGNGGDLGYSCPKHIKIYKNLNKNLDFDTINDLKPDSEFEYPEGLGVHLTSSPDNAELEVKDDSTFVEHFLPRHVFQNCQSIAIFVSDNVSGDEDDLTQLCYLELRGESTGLIPNNTVPLMAVYEAAANPNDHAKVESETKIFHFGM
ncbi:HGR016Wp [Eremothecium sinecaudum]|uniref:HGR016Wp n=1 Tax=Eremothecium sinecaudum TaxID=45286 RepID=A0A0X8HVW0_9SACH|nr:HGR016Wp [Eremothecium sinecaudum]AMD22355.1 HGR016Wp [Eremothecium sinecaudum]